MSATATSSPSGRQAFYDRIGEHSMAPLWENLHHLVSRAPDTPAQPAIWHYDDVVRPFLME
jgi:gentisate 1,2-dioxygenase